MKPKKGGSLLALGVKLLHPLLVCHALIQDALRRCKDSDLATRITVTLTKFSMTDRIDRICRVSVADTGHGMSKSLFQNFFPYQTRGVPAEFPSTDILWDGVLYITTTCLDEQMIRNYEIKLGAQDIKVVQMSEQNKRTLFRGTEASIMLEGNLTGLQRYIQDVCEKMAILNLKDVVVEYCEEKLNAHDRRETKCWSISDGGKKVEGLTSSLERLCLGFEDYTLKYISKSIEGSTHQSEMKRTIKFGKTETLSEAGPRKAQWKMQACFLLVLKENSDGDFMNCQAQSGRTQVTFFEDHYLCPQMPKEALRILSKVDWSKIGFRFKKVSERPSNTAVSAVIEWDQWPKQIERLDLVLHRFTDSCHQTASFKGELSVTKKTIEAALQDLKTNSPQFLSTSWPYDYQVQQVKTSIPDLANCISGIITSSGNEGFQEACASILNLPQPGKFILSNVRQVIEAKLFAAFNKESHQRTIEKESQILDSVEVHDLLDKAEERGEYYDIETECSKIWNYL